MLIMPVFISVSDLVRCEKTFGRLVSVKVVCAVLCPRLGLRLTWTLLLWTLCSSCVNIRRALAGNFR